MQVGFSPTQTVTTAEPSNLIQPKWYNIELSDEYIEDGEIHYQKGLTVRCLDVKGAISQGEDEDECIKNIREVIELLDEVRTEERAKKFIEDNKEIFDELGKK